MLSAQIINPHPPIVVKGTYALIHGIIDISESCYLLRYNVEL